VAVENGNDKTEPQAELGNSGGRGLGATGLDGVRFGGKRNHVG